MTYCMQQVCSLPSRKGTTQGSSCLSYCLFLRASLVESRYNFLQIIVDCRHKCKVSGIMLEMDRMLRPGGTVYIRDSISVMSELQEIATATRWVCTLRDTGEGPHASWKILTCDKRMP